jgi:hypothetical protein
MNKAARTVLAIQLHTALTDRMVEVTRTVFLLTGKAPDPMVLVHAMEQALKQESGRIGSTASLYSPAELKIRKEIACEVVAGIRRSVEGRAT